MTQRLHAIVRGRVQGVGYRAFVMHHALQFNLTGFVCNLWDGSSVEVIAEGEREQLDHLLALLERGPRSACVDRVDVEWETATGEYHYFRVRE